MVLKYFVLSLIVLTITLSDAKNTILGNLTRWSIFWYCCMKYCQWIFDNMSDLDDLDELNDENKDIFDSSYEYENNESNENENPMNGDELNEQSNDESNENPNENQMNDEDDSSYEPSEHSSESFTEPSSKSFESKTPIVSDHVKHRPITRSMTLEQ